MLVLLLQTADLQSLGWFLDRYGFPVVALVAVLWLARALGREGLAIARRLADVHVDFVSAMKRSIYLIHDRQQETVEGLALVRDTYQQGQREAFDRLGSVESQVQTLEKSVRDLAAELSRRKS